MEILAARGIAASTRTRNGDRENAKFAKDARRVAKRKDRKGAKTAKWKPEAAWGEVNQPHHLFFAIFAISVAFALSVKLLRVPFAPFAVSRSPFHR